MIISFKLAASTSSWRIQGLKLFYKSYLGKVVAPKIRFLLLTCFSKQITYIGHAKPNDEVARTCSWCEEVPKSNNHLFFNCKEINIMAPLVESLGVSMSCHSWEELLSWREKDMAGFIANASIYAI